MNENNRNIFEHVGSGTSPTCVASEDQTCLLAHGSSKHEAAGIPQFVEPEIRFVR